MKENAGLLLDNYIIIKKIGSGSFGEVWLADSVKYGYVALKIEQRKLNSRVKEEFNIYRDLHNNEKGTVDVYEFIETPIYNIISMELLGDSLEEVFVNNNKHFDIPFVMYLGVRMIDMLHDMHQVGYIHRDVKPSNFLVKHNSKDICLIDYGLSKKYILNGEHIPRRRNRSLVGTARYASINIHLGIEPSRRDDLESLGYVLLYFAIGSLPWQGLRAKNKKTSLKLIGDTKIFTSLKILCDGLPSALETYITYVRNLEFDEEPDYSYLKKLLLTAMTH